MCGIAAIVASAAHRHSHPLEAMTQALAHRGPDGHGQHAWPNCLLGHRRLSIVDLHTGSQPMLSPCDTVGLTFNGEIYDHRTRRNSLPYAYRTESDTEVLLAAYAHHGLEMCNDLRGMFAFALWDNARQRMLCARDRFGEKPLYYATADDGTLLVASQVKSLLASGLLQPQLNRQALAAFLQLGYIPENITIFNNIHQLAPGHCLLWADGSISIWPYWQPPVAAATPPTEAEAAEELQMLLGKAVRHCLQADVDVGLLLSGGLDSTTIAALATENCQPRAFAFGMEGAKDELPFARMAAAHYNLPLVEEYEREMDLAALLQELPAVYDEPLADTSCLPTLLLCRSVRAKVKCALSGDGGDELLGGYNWYTGIQQRAQALADHPQGWTRHAYAHFLRRCVCSNDELAQAGLEPYCLPLPAGLDDTPGDAMRMDAATFLPSDILRKTDRAAMSCGLELRAPFLDVDVANFLLSLPWTMKLGSTGGKHLLRRAFAHRWPAAIAQRPKQGFGMVSGGIMQHPKAAGLVQAYLHDPNLCIWKIFPKEWLLRHTQKADGLAWCLLVFSLWCEHTRKTSPFAV